MGRSLAVLSFELTKQYLSTYRHITTIKINPTTQESFIPKDHPRDDQPMSLKVHRSILDTLLEEAPSSLHKRQKNNGLDINFSLLRMAQQIKNGYSNIPSKATRNHLNLQSFCRISTPKPQIFRPLMRKTYPLPTKAYTVVTVPAY